MRKTTPIADVIMHPVRMRIIQQIGARELTTTALRETLPDVSTATLYRHVAALVDAGIVAVVGERKIRGAVERTLALGERMAHVDREELQAMDAEQLRRAFLTYLGQVAERFDESLSSDDAQARDYLGFGMTQLHVTTDDLADLQVRLGELLAPYLDPDRQGTRAVTLATILLP
ncbi:helix-turn-helix domain-containing protein [Microbacterium sp. ZW T6_19]|uniref:helix-turn-helix domain-containing protein n=1 Tax=Microbacterium sp. ZW T6_19 TaxID=3378082 RepID=UPI003853BDAF